MKHIAQDELEFLCTLAGNNPSASGEFFGKMLQEADDTLQDLINCQLTVEEIDKIIIGLAFLPSRFFTVEQEQVLLDKIIKQKEMWVIEDETN